MSSLKPNPVLKDYQEYFHQLEIERGFEDLTALQKCLILGEETGELFKAIRKNENIQIDANSEIGTISHELADVFHLILSISNHYNIDLEQAFRDKDKINQQRVWNKSK